MTNEKATIRCEAIFSDDKKYRYLLSKVWDKNRPIATVISISPSAFYNVTCDTTTMLIQNNLEALGCGGMELVNLISKVGVEAKRLKSLIDNVGQETDHYILESVKRTALTVFAWGRIAGMNKAFQAREAEVLKLLEPYMDKVQTISDCAGRENLHPLTPSIRNEWNLSLYQWKTAE